jgi:molecular chaperone DnaK (HSP70)
MKVIQGLLLAALICLVGSQVIGIDLGTEFWKASLISPGKNLIIVENSRSSRKSHNGVHKDLYRLLFSKELGISSMMLIANASKNQRLHISI